MRISDWSSDVCSSDLAKADVTAAFAGVDVECGGGSPPDPDPVALENGVAVTDMEIGTNHALRYTLDVAARRSGEHTSELQLLMRNLYAGFRLTNKNI